MHAATQFAPLGSNEVSDDDEIQHCHRSAEDSNLGIRPKPINKRRWYADKGATYKVGTSNTERRTERKGECEDQLLPVRPLDRARPTVREPSSRPHSAKIRRTSKRYRNNLPIVRPQPQHWLSFACREQQYRRSCERLQEPRETSRTASAQKRLI